MAWVEAHVERDRHLDAPREHVHEVVRDIPTVARLIPRVDHAEELDGGAWRWVVEEHHALGYTVQPAFTVRIEADPPRTVRFVHEPDHDAPAGRTGGGITLDASGPARTVATVEIRVDLDLPIPRLLRGPARSLIELEVRRSVDRFLANLADEVAAPR